MQHILRQLMESGQKISIPYLQRKFKLSATEAKKIYQQLFPNIQKKRTYYFETYWVDEWEKSVHRQSLLKLTNDSTET